MRAEHLHSINHLLSIAITAEKAWTGRTWVRCSRSQSSTSRMKPKATTHMTRSRSNGEMCVRPSLKVHNAAKSCWSLQKPSKVKQVMRSVIRRHNTLLRRKWQMITPLRKRRKAQKLRGCFNRRLPCKDLRFRIFKYKDRSYSSLSQMAILLTILHSFSSSLQQYLSRPTHRDLMLQNDLLTDRCRQARFWNATIETSYASSTHQTL